MAATPQKTTAKKATAKKATAKKATAKKATATRSSSPARTPLLERERTQLADDARYVVAGLAVDAVALGKAAVAKIAELRAEVADDPRGTVRDAANEAPATASRTVESLRHRLIVELESAIRAFERTFDEKATEGRQLVDSLKQDDRVTRFLDQSSSTRAQVKGALTSVTRTVEVAAEAARKQADTAVTQVKGAVTSVGRSAGTVGDAAEATTEKVDRAS